MMPNFPFEIESQESSSARSAHQQLNNTDYYPKRNNTQTQHIGAAAILKKKLFPSIYFKYPLFSSRNEC